MSRLISSLPLMGVVLVFGTGAYAFNVYQLGSREGNPWQAALSYQPGEYVVIGLTGQVQERRRIRSSATHSTWQETLAVFIDSTSGQWLRPFFVPDTLNLAQDGVRDRVRRGLFDNLATSDFCSEQGSGVRKIRLMFDGSPNTAAFFLARNSDAPSLRAGDINEPSQTFIQNIIADLGTNYPVNRVRFFPRLGRANPKIDEILAGMTPPELKKEALAEEDFSNNFLPGFEVVGANSLQNFPEDCRSEGRTNPWFSRISPGEEVKNDSRFTIIKKDAENLDIVVDIRFPTQAFQWVGFRPLSPTRNWEIAEFQVFGTGYVPRTVYTSAILDLGENMVFGKLRWGGEKGEDAQVLIQTRSGTDEDPNRYWTPSLLSGEFVEIPRQEYELLPVTERKVTLDEEHWNFWSPPYPWKAGLKDPALAAHLWKDGTPILSPGPARYFQFHLLFLSTLTDAARFRELEVQFSKPAAEQVVAEIWPLDVPRGQRTTFTYTALPTLTDRNLGFDRLEIFTLTRADTVRSVEVDQVKQSEAFPPEILEDRIVVRFPKLEGAKDTSKLIKVVFDVPVVLYGTEFRGWVFDSQAYEVKQLVVPGDADIEFEGDALGVRTEGVEEGVLSRVKVSPNPFTPNGDGINEVARFFFAVYQVSAPRALSLHLYDMAGRHVREVGPVAVIRGEFGEQLEGPVWDGRDEGGRKVPPGIYLYRLFLEVDQGEAEQLGTVSVAY